MYLAGVGRGGSECWGDMGPWVLLAVTKGLGRLAAPWGMGGEGQGRAGARTGMVRVASDPLGIHYGPGECCRAVIKSWRA